MTETIIILFSIIVWLAKGHYDPSIIVLVACFLFWVYTTIFKNVKFKFGTLVFQYFPIMAGIMMLVNSNLNSVSDVIRPYYFYFRFVPLSLSLISYQVKNKNIILILFLMLFISVLLLSPNPFIDVYRCNAEAAQVLLKGLNPYSHVYPDLYRGEFGYHPSRFLCNLYR